jgi:hypothetical protein
MGKEATSRWLARSGSKASKRSTLIMTAEVWVTVKFTERVE